MRTYWFNDMESGEEFFVEAHTPAEAWSIAADIFEEENLNCYGSISTAYAEMLGYDTY